MDLLYLWIVRLACRLVMPYRLRMTIPPIHPHKSALLSFRFLGTALIGSLVMALVAAFAPPPAQLAATRAFVIILGGRDDTYR